MSDSSANRSPETTSSLASKTRGLALRHDNIEQDQPSLVNCRDFENRMQDLLDARRQPDSDPAIRFHADQCRACRLLLTQFQQLESVLASAFQARSEEQPEISKPAPLWNGQQPRVGRRPSRPVHPVSRSQRAAFELAARAAVLVLLTGFGAFQIGFAMKQPGSLLPVTRSGGSIFVAGSPMQVNDSGIRPVVNYRSLEQCYELTIELPGVRSLQTSILVALDWCRDYFKLDGGEMPKPPHHERGFGLNPLRADINRLV